MSFFPASHVYRHWLMKKDTKPGRAGHSSTIATGMGAVSPLNDGGLDMAEELRSVLRWEDHRMGAVSKGVLKSVIDRLDAQVKS